MRLHLQPFNNQLKVRHFLKYHQISITAKGNLQFFLLKCLNKCSNLNNDLFNNHLREDTFCPNCGAPEDAKHYFFKCAIYRSQRLTMFYSTRPLHPLSTKLLLFGDDKRSNDENLIIVDAVLTYIKDTKRFL